MAPGPQFTFGTHPEHGFVAASHSTFPQHLAHWFLVREQFEPVPSIPGLYRLTHPEHDGPRRTRQAAHDLLKLGYTAHTDLGLDPDAPAVAVPRPHRAPAPPGRWTRLAQAAATRSPQHQAAPTTAPPTVRVMPPKPVYAPTVHLAAGRSR
ncbi:hypothetical protein GTY81_20120 [Streptomyces sp. SID8366]|uniref:hypothetical protein n=1 Tax=unclassified Streptomyces TaxID=2593676 RepID=UPI000DBAAAAC|nr:MULTISPECIES: hypothetical protein [unclassified Streptomyces]MYU06140.1 hypothetical protein [Streptomyces sp. SID8366]MYU61714.1 hypothetical protein [Streptomyces sp. SID69]RAJ64212.1 hypothetical protein K376_01309 [Streptomyces sp. PsTaAH-130]